MVKVRNITREQRIEQAGRTPFAPLDDRIAWYELVASRMQRQLRTMTLNDDADMARFHRLRIVYKLWIATLADMKNRAR